MKKLTVSSTCIACGICVMQTDLLKEDAKGYVHPVADAYIQDSEMVQIQALINNCPAKAIQIVDDPLQNMSNEQLLEKLKQEMNKVKIDEVRGYPDLKYDEKKYSVNIPRAKGFYSYDYSSERAALNAGHEIFKSTFWNQKKRFLLDFAAQYKADVVRRYLDPDCVQNPFFSSISQQYEDILRRTAAVIRAKSCGTTVIPDDFCVFRPEATRDFKQLMKKMYDDIDSTDYIDKMATDFEHSKVEIGNVYGRLKYYLHFIDSDSMDTFAGLTRSGKMKEKTMYCYTEVNECGESMVNDLAFFLGCPDSPSNSIEISAEQSVNFVISRYRMLAKNEIDKKLAECKKILNII